MEYLKNNEKFAIEIFYVFNRKVYEIWLYYKMYNTQHLYVNLSQ